MKKLMTTLSAVAVAFGLYASTPLDTGTSFEGIEIPLGGSSVALDIDSSTGELEPAGEGYSYWVTNENSTLTVIAGRSSTDDRPYQFSKADQDRYLNIKTTLGNPVTRKVDGAGSGADIGSGYYFDSLVKFTAFDSDPTSLFDSDNGRTVITNEGKIAIWLKENIDPATDLPTSTNLMITAGYLVGGSVVATNYSCAVIGNVNINDGGWHRVTVRAVENIYKTQPNVPGFVVYIDQYYVGSIDGTTMGIDSTQIEDDLYGLNLEKAVFPSAVQGEGADVSVIKAVDFDGQGDVDDLVFTATKPDFITDVECFTVEIGEGVESVTMHTYDMNGTEIAKGCGTFTTEQTLKYEADMYVIINSISYADGYIEDEVATNGNVEVEAEYNKYLPQEGNTGIEIKAKRLGATVVVGDKTNTYETVALAMSEKINDPEFSGTATLTLNTTAFDGIVLDNENADLILDLAGYDITNETEAAAISIVAGSLTIINSTEDIGHVVGNGVEYADEAVYASAGTTLAITEGVYDGAVYHEDENLAQFTITGGIFDKVANDNYGVVGFLTLAVKAGLGGSYGLVEDGDYYVIDETGSTAWRVTFMDGGDEYDHDDVEDGELVAKPDDPTKDGYKFNGWYEDGAEEPFSFTTVAITNNLTLYANWSLETYNITYNLDLEGATNAVANVSTYTYNDAVVIEDAGCVGYTFNGWTNTEGQVVSAIALHSTGNVELYASWEATEYSITYLYEDGTAFDDWAEGYSVTNTYTIEDVIVLPTADNVDLGDGGEFKGWTNAVGTAIAGWPAGGMSGPVVLYAKIDAVVPPTKHDAGATILCEDSTEAAELAAAITATPAAYVNVPAGVANGAAYCALFRGVADGSKVTIELTADAKTAAQTAVDAAAATIPLSAIASGAIGSQVVIDAVPGLYYSVSVGETCTGLVETTPRVLAQDTGAGANINDGKLAILVGKPSSEATAGFYKVNVNVEPAPQN